MAEHTKNKRPSTSDKHTDRRSGTNHGPGVNSGGDRKGDVKKRREKNKR